MYNNKIRRKKICIQIWKFILYLFFIEDKLTKNCRNEKFERKNADIVSDDDDDDNVDDERIMYLCSVQKKKERKKNKNKMYD